jgi:hypothetical protein
MPTFTLTISDLSTDDDKDGALHIVNKENNRRAALDSPEAPLDISTDEALQASYVEVWNTKIAPEAHTSYIKQALYKWIDDQEILKRTIISSKAERNAAVALLKNIP